MRTAINLFSVRALDWSMEAVLDRVAAAGYDGVQFSAGLRGANPAAVRETLDDLGLSATPPHVGIGRLENDLGEIVAVYGETIGATGVVVPSLDEASFASPEAVDGAARRLSELEDRLATYDWRLHYHNHAFEFDRLDGGTAFDGLVERIDDAIRVELDVGWALAGGEDPASLLARFGDRVDLIHMKDVDLGTRSPCKIGEGDVDMLACAAAANEANADWLVYEHDSPVDPAASIDAGAAFLESL